MEDKRTLIFISVLGALAASPIFVFAYSDETTHPALTSETVRLFNERVPEHAFSKEEKELIMRGSTNEDAFTRPLQHFYDPVNEAGLVIGGTEFASALRWATDTKVQAAYVGNTARVPGVSALYGSVKKTYSSDTDHSWDRAVYEYAWDDKERALETLGHILHLVQDMSVPAHTRNDPHPHFAKSVFGGPSPYEGWAAQFTPEDGSIETMGRIPVRSSLEGHLATVAEYSNENFLSKDSIDNSYPRPEVEDDGVWIRLSDGASHRFSYAEDGQTKLLQTGVKILGTPEKRLSITDPDNLILSDYWNLLSEQAVLHGAGIIKLFFKKVEEERETKELALKNRDWADKIYDATAGVIYGLVGDLYGTSVPYEELNTRGAESVERATGERVEPDKADSEEDAKKNQGQTAVARASKQASNDAEVSSESQPNSTESSVEQSAPHETATGGPVIAGDAVTIAEVSKEENDGNSGRLPGGGYTGGGGSSSGGGGNGGGSSPSDTTPPNAPVFTGASTSSPRTIVGTTTATFMGTSEAGATVEAVYNPTATTTADGNGDWDIAVTGLPQGTTTIAFTAIDTAGNRSTSTDATVFVDSQAPQPDITIAECSDSLVASGCLATTTVFSVSWDTSTTSDFSYYILDIDGVVSTTTATSTTATTTDFSTLSIAVSARDTYGNTSATSSADVTAATQPVVINEIAWMGTEASSDDEWIELYNPTSHAIDLSDWVLIADDADPYIHLSGNIAADGYFILERTDETTLASTTADQIYTGPLDDSGDALILARVAGNATTTIDTAPADGGGNYTWCGGLHGSRFTMERIDPKHAGSDCDNWSYTDKQLANGADADGNTVNGTPGKRNGANYNIEDHLNLAGSSGTVTLSSADSPYFVADDVTVGNSQTLIVDAGTVVKADALDEPRIRVLGKMESDGTASEPVVFTSFYDDDYGDDMNGDGSCAPDNASSTAMCPEAGDWDQLFFFHAGPASLKHTIVRYGGDYSTPADARERSAIAVVESRIDFEDLVVEKNKQHGLYLSNATSTITDATFRDNWNRGGVTSGDGAGIYAEDGGDVTIRDSLFENNDNGMEIRVSAVVENNTFRDNNKLAAEVDVSRGTYRDNAGSGNGTNALQVYNGAEFTRTGATTTLAANDIAYLIQNGTDVVASSTLTFEPGVVVKGNAGNGWPEAWITIRGGGTMSYDGTNTDDVTFTSHHDDTVGGQTDSATSTAPSAGDWHGIWVRSGGMFDMAGFTLRYAGSERGSQVSGIRFDSGMASSSIASAILEDNAQFGIHVAGDRGVSISDTTIRNHSQKESGNGSPAGLYAGDGMVSMDTVEFSNNTPYDIRAESAANVTCANCTVASTSPSDLLD